jgi:hypothetical protein
MGRFLTIVAAGLGVCGLWGMAAGAPGARAAGPQDAAGTAAPQPAMERVNLLHGGHYDGFIESEDDFWLYFIQIGRPPGKPMHLVIRTLDRGSLASVVRLDAQRRAELHGQIEQFLNRAAIEAGRMEAVSLLPLEREGDRYQHYAGKWFTLDSKADERMTRRIIVRVEQIFAAYRQMLPPRPGQPRPPRLVVFNSMEQYQAFLARRGVKIRNQACFLEGEDVVAIGSDLGRLAARMAVVNAQVAEIRCKLAQMEKRLPARQRELADKMRKEGRSNGEIAGDMAMLKRQFDDDAKKKKKELDRYERETAQTFNIATRQMFARVYHESFHAYLENYVYPHDRYDVPRWLNEGLAVTLEGGILDGDALRVDAPHPAALKRLKADLLGPQPLRLQQLLSADGVAFLELHDASSAASARLYAYAWGVAYYLAFQQHLLSSPALAQYVAPEAKKLPPVERFERLVGMPLGKFEQQWREYILRMKDKG